VKKGDCTSPGNYREDPGTSEETVPKAKQEGKSNRRKIIGKPYSGKLNVRGGELEIEL